MKKIEPTLTARSVIIGVVWSVVLTLGIWVARWTFDPQLAFQNRYEQGVMFRWSMVYDAIPTICFLFIPVFFNAIVPKKWRLRASELAFIFASVSVWRLGGPTYFSVLYQGYMWYYQKPEYASWVDKYWTSIVFPTDKAVYEGWVVGGVPIPWAVWIVPMLYWSAMWISLYLLLVLLGGLLARGFIDRESLPFPLATAYAETIKLGSTSNMFKAKSLWIAALIGFMEAMGEYADLLVPGTAPIFLEIDVTKITLATSILFFAFQPVMFGFGLLQNYDILFTTAMTYIVAWIIIPPIAESLGWWIPTEPGFSAGYHQWSFPALLGTGMGRFQTATSPSWRGYTPLYFGILVTVALLPLYTHRRYLWRSLKGIFGKPEEDEDMPYRLIWIGIFACAIIYIATVSYLVPIWTALLMLGIYVVMTGLAQARIEAESGGVLGTIRLMGGALLFGDVAVALKNAGLMNETHLLRYAFLNSYRTKAGGGHTWFPMDMALTSLKVGDAVGAKRSDILKATVIGAIITPIVGMVFLTWLIYTFGLGIRNATDTGHVVTSYALPYFEGKVQSDPRWNIVPYDYISFAIGIILTLAIVALRLKVGGIFSYINPIGILLPLYYGGQYTWIPFIVALIVKKLAFKVGGAKIFERLVPIAVGLMLGYALSYIPLTVICSIRAIPPW